MILAVAASAIAGCKATRPAPPPHDGQDSLQLVTESMSIRHGKVGEGEHEVQATYALVDVRNGGDRDLQVSVGGTLESKAGQSWPVRPEVLVVPGHGVRTFALVPQPPRSLPGATSIHPVIERSQFFSYPPTVVVEDGHVFADGDRVVVKGRAVNERKRHARAVLIAGFYDADAKPMERQFTVVDLDAEQSHALQFVGPPGSKSAYIFVGDTSY